jgi:hypothetical protein|tara:strand:- start:793 stop:1101 length:309 start_codon:yes stop_codon:yes gene_type:complete
MNIIIGKEIAEELGKKYTVLPLETLERDGNIIDAFCVIPGDKVNLGEMVSLDANIRLHHSFLDAYENKDNVKMNEIAGHLMGKFGGEVDTFYTELLSREIQE